MMKAWFLYLLIVSPTGEMVAPTEGPPLASAFSQENCELAGEYFADHLAMKYPDGYTVIPVCYELDKSVEKIIK